MSCIALTYGDYRFPCGPEDCSESVTCWNDIARRPLLNSPKFGTDLSSAFDGHLECEHYGDKGETVLQKRMLYQPSVAFNGTWHDYETGFGSDSNYWIGLKSIHRLSSRGRNLLKVEIIDIYGISASEQYSGFWVDDASSRYTMYAGPSHGNDDPLEPCRGRPFTAPDGGREGCANEFGSGWWFPSSCQRTLINLNGRHNTTGSDLIFGHNIRRVAYARMAMRKTFIHCDKTCPNGGTCRKSRNADSYICDCRPRYTGSRCEVSLEDTTVAKAYTTTDIITSSSLRASISRNVTSSTTPSPLDVYDLFAYLFLPGFVVITFVGATSALIVRKCIATRKKTEIHLNTGEESPLVRKRKRHKKRRRSQKPTKRNTS